MEITFKCILLILLGITAVQDFTTRTVSVLLFPAVFIIIFLLHIHVVSGIDLLIQVACCFLFLLIQLVLLAAYFFLAKKNLHKIKQSLGLGDVLFMGCLCFLFSPVNYIAFHVFSLTSGLAFAVTTRYFWPQQSQTIPLAGLQAILLTGLIVLGTVYPPVPMFTDTFLLAKLKL